MEGEGEERYIEKLGEDEGGEGDGDDVDEVVLEEDDRQNHDDAALVHTAQRTRN
jgi:hypothetical protein